MRIQETDRILKESRYARHAHAANEQEHEGLMQRVWKKLSRVTEMFKK